MATVIPNRKRKSNYFVSANAKKPKSAVETSKQALRKVNRLSRSLQGELKYRGIAGAQTVTSAATSFHKLLPDIPEGTQGNERIGNYVTIKKIQMKLAIAGSTPSRTQLRILVVSDSQHAASIPDIEDVLDVPLGVLAHFPKPSQKGRFRVHYDKLLTFDNVGFKSAVVNEDLIMNHKVHYNGALGSQVISQGIYLMMISSESSLGPSVDYDVRCSYTDS